MKRGDHEDKGPLIVDHEDKMSKEGQGEKEKKEDHEDKETLIEDHEDKMSKEDQGEKEKKEEINLEMNKEVTEDHPSNLPKFQLSNQEMRG